MRVYLKRLTGIFRSMLLAGLTVILLASASGLSFKAHYCNGNLTGIAFYTELGLQKPVNCGCGHHPSGAPVPSGEALPLLQKASCCSNISYYSKLEIVSKAAGQWSLVQPDAPVSASEENKSLPVSVEAGEENKTAFKLRPPPMSGRKLVLFLSQQRIPSPIYS